MTFRPLPPSAAWRHHTARSGFEVAFFEESDGRIRLTGSTTAVEDNVAWSVDYAIDVDPGWRTTRAVVRSRSTLGERTTVVTREHDEWKVDGVLAPELQDCVDIDLESSAVTNTLPVHRLGLVTGERADVPAVYVRAVDLSVHRLEQTYERRPDEGGRQLYAYSAPLFDFSAVLRYDESGLVVDYPGLAERYPASASGPVL